MSKPWQPYALHILDAALALLNRTGGEPPQAGDEIL